MRTHNCNQLGISLEGEEVVLCGWAENVRHHGGMVFINLIDRWGLCQVIVDPNVNTGDVNVKNNDVIKVRGKISLRPEEMVNAKQETGKIELVASEVCLLNASEPLPFSLHEDASVNDDTRLRYRYLDLRRPALRDKLILRSRILTSIRRFLESNEFIEVETPILTKATPEGARDYLVPSRVHPDNFFALPQSPQLFKQMLMVAGFERYYQIARCFRDEDLRADRQPEFTQLDMEFSFVEQEDILTLTENLFQQIVKDNLGKELSLPIARLDYDEAMNVYGSDSPDMRFEILLQDLSAFFKDTDIEFFKSALAQENGSIRGICVPDCADKMSRKDVDALNDFVKKFKARGVAWIKVKENEWQSPLAKFFDEEQRSNLEKQFNAKAGDMIFLIADEKPIVLQSLGQLRVHLAKKLSLIDTEKMEFVWIVNFPMFEQTDTGEPSSVHHPFTAINAQDKQEYLDGKRDLYSLRTNAYDLVLNGHELGGGSLRIYNSEDQQFVFKTLGLNEAEIEEKFGFFLEALRFGAPPHGGIAFGVDRIAMLLSKGQSLRDVIAFPKTNKATCLLTDAPSPISEQQYEDLHIRSSNDKERESI